MDTLQVCCYWHGVSSDWSKNLMPDVKSSHRCSCTCAYCDMKITGRNSRSKPKDATTQARLLSSPICNIYYVIVFPPYVIYIQLFQIQVNIFACFSNLLSLHSLQQSCGLLPSVDVGHACSHSHFHSDRNWRVSLPCGTSRGPPRLFGFLGPFCKTCTQILHQSASLHDVFCDLWT